MSKEEILRAYVGNCIWEDNIDCFSIDNTDSKTICKAMETYAKQECAPLLARITQLQHELSMLQDYIINKGI